MSSEGGLSLCRESTREPRSPRRTRRSRTRTATGPSRGCDGPPRSTPARSAETASKRPSSAARTAAFFPSRPKARRGEGARTSSPAPDSSSRTRRDRARAAGLAGPKSCPLSPWSSAAPPGRGCWEPCPVSGSAAPARGPRPARPPLGRAARRRRQIRGNSASKARTVPTGRLRGEDACRDRARTLATDRRARA